MPDRVAAGGRGKTERIVQGKTISIIGQIDIAGLISKGGDRGSVTAIFCGQMPPDIAVDVRDAFHYCFSAFIHDSLITWRFASSLLRL